MKFDIITIVFLVVGFVAITSPFFLAYREISFYKQCKGTYHMGRPSLCVSKDGRILDVL